jgi:hypothetical protein
MTKVWVCPAGQGSDVYHTERCSAVRRMENPIREPESRAQARGLRMCEWCSGDADPDENTDYSRDLYQQAKAIGESN